MRLIKANKADMIERFKDENLPLYFLNDFIERVDKDDGTEKKWICSFLTLDRQSNIKIRKHTKQDEFIVELIDN